MMRACVAAVVVCLEDLCSAPVTYLFLDDAGGPCYHCNGVSSFVRVRLFACAVLWQVGVGIWTYRNKAKSRGA